VLYGATQQGGASGAGTIFSLAPPTTPGGAWTEAVLHSFATTADGNVPFAGVLLIGGTLYGTTEGGGVHYQGTIFSLSPPTAPGGQWRERILHSFEVSPEDGLNPYSPLVFSNGVFYTTTHSGGANGGGTVYSLTPPSLPSGSWTGTVVHSFAPFSSSSVDGIYPGSAVLPRGGVPYGTTPMGGMSAIYGGVVYAVKP
jgi:uncharacterized repeat protein (TIGR03803 family)